MPRLAGAERIRPSQTAKGSFSMKKTIWAEIGKRLQELFTEQYGQDLVEYALVVALIAFGATAGIKSLAAGVKT
jgi:pilus assembly protein Flp/PilA